jgi:hypothetical protein
MLTQPHALMHVHKYTHGFMHEPHTNTHVHTNPHGKNRYTRAHTNIHIAHMHAHACPHMHSHTHMQIGVLNSDTQVHTLHCTHTGNTQDFVESWAKAQRLLVGTRVKHPAAQ